MDEKVLSIAETLFRVDRHFGNVFDRKMELESEGCRRAELQLHKDCRYPFVARADRLGFRGFLLAQSGLDNDLGGLDEKEFGELLQRLSIVVVQLVICHV